MKKVICFLWFLVSGVRLSAATVPDVQDPGYDTAYVKSFRDYLVVTFVSSLSGNEISVTDTNDRSITFGTNLPMSFGLGLDYKWFTFEYTSSFGRTGDSQKGNTEMKSIGFGLTGRKFWFRNFYQSTQGYYLENPKYFDNGFDPSTDIYPHRADIRSTVYYASLNYGFNYRKFSNMAALWQLERQKKSAGSFTAGLTYSFAFYEADSALVPKEYQGLFDKDDFITDFDFSMVGLNVGYLHTFSFTRSRKFFISLALIPGISYQEGTSFVKQTDKTKTDSEVGFHTEARFVAGYNGDRWYTSLSSIGYAVTSAFDNANPFSQGYTFGRFVVGYKIKMPETKSTFLKKIGL